LLDAAPHQFGLHFGFLARAKIDFCFKGQTRSVSLRVIDGGQDWGSILRAD
jgi:hypothetical protein